MKSYYVLLNVLIILSAYYIDIRVQSKTTGERCTGGQVWSKCKGCTITCDPRPIVCPAICVTGCRCPSGRPVWHQGKCIVRKNCRKCKGSQVFKECASACDRTCDDPVPACTRQCVQRCECPQDRPILHKGVCINQDGCPNACPSGQIFNTCGSACDKTCEDPIPVCTKQCVARCECPADKPINHNGQCVTQTECCSGGQEYNFCGSACTKTCRNPNPICTLQCEPRCECPAQRPVLLNFQCVDARECPACGGGQVWSECGTFCNKTCDNPNPVCPQFIACMAGCDCPADRPIIHMGNCIHRDSCPNYASS